jgi:hypothetical protein
MVEESGLAPVENSNKGMLAIETGCVMGQKEKVASVLNMVGGKAENVEKIVDEIDRFFNTINAELEDWKVSMEEYQDGTRIYARFQVLMKK